MIGHPSMVMNVLVLMLAVTADPARAAQHYTVHLDTASPRQSALVLENANNADITGFHAVFTCDYGKADLFFDTIFNYGANKPIPPGGHFVYSIPSSIAKCPGGIDAVAFSNGVIEGNANAAAALVKRRSAAIDELKHAQLILPPLNGDQWNIRTFRQSMVARRNEVALVPSLPADETAVRQHIIDTLKLYLDVIVGKDVATTDLVHRQRFLARFNEWLQAATEDEPQALPPSH